MARLEAQAQALVSVDSVAWPWKQLESTQSAGLAGVSGAPSASPSWESTVGQEVEQSGQVRATTLIFLAHYSHLTERW